MPRRQDINNILILGAGPIIIGQACEFDYSGTQALQTLKEEGVRSVLLNSNPATIMTDPDTADVTYIEPVDAQSACAIIKKEKIDAVLPTMGGQTALNCAMELDKMGVFGKGLAIDGKPMLIGANAHSINKAEDRQAFKKAMDSIGLKSAPSAIISSIYEGEVAVQEIGFPIIVRPSFTLGGTGGGIAYNKEEFRPLIAQALLESPTKSILIERSLIGWKEFEMEVMRDHLDNCIIVCSIENFDPMGVHTGDSITVAPAQTLSDKEYQRMRNASIAVLREIGVDSGGSNVQFAVNPIDGDLIVIEMNPRVSRSSALASKATGFPIAKVATRLALGYTLDEIRNDITGKQTPISFEPSIDYIVTKIPRFDFRKFTPTPDILTTQMRSVGEVMAIGKTFAESIQKSLSGLEIKISGFKSSLNNNDVKTLTLLATGDELNDDLNALIESLKPKLSVPSSTRILHVADAFRLCMSVEQINALTHIDPWFLCEISDIIETEKNIINFASKNPIDAIDKPLLREWKRLGFSDEHLQWCFNLYHPPTTGAKRIVSEIAEHRTNLGLHPVFKRIDTCAAEFPTSTAYLYSCYEDECELHPTDNKKIMILGSGPNRIGQGIEFDYCCVHGIMALREEGFETIMVNCNPETVSTDYNTANRLFFEPLTVENVWEIIVREKPFGVIVQFGGQTPLSIARVLSNLGAPIIGTSVDAIDLSESRRRFQQLLLSLELKQPKNAIVHCTPLPFSIETNTASEKSIKEQITNTAESVAYPLVIRPSYVLGGQAMSIVHNKQELEAYVDKHAYALQNDVLLDRFVDNAIEVDVDAVRDHTGEIMIAGVMEHIERAGIHSGDSACCLPPHSLPQHIVDSIKEQTKKLAQALNVIGLMNVQYAVQNETIYVLEVNPRASRTSPFVSKATGVPIAKIAAKAMAGICFARQQVTIDMPDLPYYSVKEAVFPFNKFPGVDVLLGPEMKSTGESMGIGKHSATAYYLAQEAILPHPSSGTVVFSVRNQDKPSIVPIAQSLVDIGFKIVATSGTAAYLKEHGVAVETIRKAREGRPHIVDFIIDNKACMIVNTEGNSSTIRSDSFDIRHAALMGKVMHFTTIAATQIAVEGIKQSILNKGRPDVSSLQTWQMQQSNKITER